MPDENSEVGFARPPKASRFRPGESGNPSGRPKGRRNFVADICAELQSTITFAEGGRQVIVTKQRVIAKKLVAAAIDGDMRALRALLELSTRMVADQRQKEDDGLSEEETEIVKQFHERSVHHDESGAPPNPSSPGDSKNG